MVDLLVTMSGEDAVKRQLEQIETSPEPLRAARKIIFHKPSRPPEASIQLSVLSSLGSAHFLPKITRAFAHIAAAHTAMNSGKLVDAYSQIIQSKALLESDFDAMPEQADYIRENRIHLFFSHHSVQWQIHLLNGSSLVDTLQNLEGARLFVEQNADSGNFSGKFFFQTSTGVLRVLGAEMSLAYRESADTAEALSTIAGRRKLFNRIFDLGLQASWDHHVIRHEFRNHARVYVAADTLSAKLSSGTKSEKAEFWARSLFHWSIRTRGMDGMADTAGASLRSIWTGAS